MRKKRTRAKQIAQRGKLMSRMKFLCQVIVRDIARVEDDLQKSQRQEAFCAKAPPYTSRQENSNLESAMQHTTGGPTPEARAIVNPMSP